LTIEGEDPGSSGIRDYSLFVSEDGEPFEPLLVGFDETEVSFTGEPGVAYAFYSTSRDNVYNVEGVPAVADLLVMIVPDADADGIPDDEDNCPNVANPLQEDTNDNGVGDACEPVVPGDLDGDGDVDRNDVLIILAARNTPASGSGDPRDVDGDGIISVNDARRLVLMCTRPRCAVDG
jgi:hypothetical protein